VLGIDRSALKVADARRHITVAGVAVEQASEGSKITDARPVAAPPKTRVQPKVPAAYLGCSRRSSSRHNLDVAGIIDHILSSFEGLVPVGSKSS
jgi:hypothetical protein